ncbi:hypothetical protein FS837_006468 [Tulasnella sp. UAMH 9824]|nr:hypothetical protein FS837_006468 [Tulasnella sp. UAMH 9824]
MGNDGGSIPDRRDLVKTKAKAEQADKNNQTLAAWFFCALSKRPLQEPIVSCALGKLYNKDALLEYLLDKSAYGDGAKICGHIKSLKDVVTLRLTPNPAYTSSPSDDSVTNKRAQFICPLNLKEMTGNIPFVYLATCGCVFSSAGLKAISTPYSSSSEDEGNKKEPCPQCGKSFSCTDDVRTINPTPDEQERMMEKMLAAKASAKSNKKKRKDLASTNGAIEDAAPPSKRTKAAADSVTPPDVPSPAPSINPMVSSVARKVTAQIAEEEKKRKANMSKAIASLYAPKDGGPKEKGTFLTMNTFTRYA